MRLLTLSFLVTVGLAFSLLALGIVAFRSQHVDCTRPGSTHATVLNPTVVNQIGFTVSQSGDFNR